MLLLFMIFIRLSYAQISFCGDDTVIGLRMCANEDYNKAWGETKPTMIKEKIILFDIKEFNADEKTVTLFLMLFSYWNDSRVMVKSSDPNQ